jgi:demethylmenaquinone methyltransferase/2-methoxy-6-polyprenyl-1,4-benzoquinol methylase
MISTDNFDPVEERRDASAKNQYVRRMFNNISRRYDFLNHFLSAGIDRIWRKKAIKLSGLAAGNTFLDVACGTGDLSVEAAKSNPKKIVGVDFAENMLSGFRAKKESLGLDGKVEIIQASAEELPFAEGAFDVAAVAFGARNFGDLKKGLAEMHRVLKSGGRVVVLEFSKPKVFPIRELYFMYFRHILPAVGKIVSGDGGAYAYLPESVSAFPDGDDFEEVMRIVNFREVRSVPMTFGIATAYYGIK